MTENKYREMPRWLLIVAAVFLTNPIVNIFDYLPDAIGYFILVIALGFFADRVPYFAEARVAFLRLGFVSLAKLPAFLIMIFARGQNVADNDIKALMNFSFSVIELLLLITAIKNLFEALGYLGQRSECAGLILPFKIGRSERLMPVETLTGLCYAFAILRTAASALPEMLLLTRGVSSENYGKVFNPASLYPLVITLSVVSVFVFGIILCCRISDYLKAISLDGRLYSSADRLIDLEGRDQLNKKLLVRRMTLGLGFISVAAFSFIDVNPANFGGIDVLPDFIFGILMFVTVILLRNFLKDSKFALISSLGFALISSLSYVFKAIFLYEYGYEALVLSPGARESYLQVMVICAVETVALLFCLVSLGKLLCNYVTDHNGIGPHDRGYSRLDAEYHKKAKNLVKLTAAFGIGCCITKILSTVFRFYARRVMISTDFGAEFITEGFFPLIGAVNFAFCLIFALLCHYLIDRVKEETRIKYQ